VGASKKYQAGPVHQSDYSFLKNQTHQSKAQKPASTALEADTRKTWQKPELAELSIRQTQSGIITDTFEGPFNFLFGS